MGFTVNDLQDLIRLLEENPQWRAQLRPVILGEEFDRMPGIMRELAEAQQRTTDSLAGLTARVDQLVEAQARTDARIEQLVEAQVATEAKLASLIVIVEGLAKRADRADTKFEFWDGFYTQYLFERRAPALFGDWLRRPRVVSLEDSGAEDAVDQGLLTDSEMKQLRRLDIILSGRDKSIPDASLTLAVEISRTIDYDDVDRASQRAAIFAKAGIPARGAVGGLVIDERVEQFARERNVIVRIATAAELPR